MRARATAGQVEAPPHRQYTTASANDDERGGARDHACDYARDHACDHARPRCQKAKIRGHLDARLDALRLVHLAFPNAEPFSFKELIKRLGRCRSPKTGRSVMRRNCTTRRPP